MRRSMLLEAGKCYRNGLQECRGPLRLVRSEFIDQEGFRYLKDGRSLGDVYNPKLGEWDLKEPCECGKDLDAQARREKR